MNKIAVSCALLASFAGLAFAPFALGGADQCTPRKVSVSGAGSARAAPGLYVFRVGIVQRGTSVQTAHSAVNQSAAAAVHAALEAGVARRDIRSTNISISPVYDSDRGPREAQVFAVKRTISIVLRDPSHYAELAEGLIDAGVNRITRIEAKPAHPQKMADKALAEAVANAAHKARLIARKLGAKLGPALRISQSGGVHPMPRAAAMSIGSAAVGGGYVQGRITTHAQVSATFALSPSGCR